MRIQVVLRKNRSLTGKLSVMDGSGQAVLFGPVPCLGRADNKDAKLHQNPNRDPKLQFGDTPTGEYLVTTLVPHGPGETTLHTYGAHPSLLLDPSSGDALLAKNGGRTG